MRRRRNTDKGAGQVLELTGTVRVTMQPAYVKEERDGKPDARLAGFWLEAVETEGERRTVRVPFPPNVAQLLAASTLDFLDQAQSESPAPSLEVVRDLPASLKGREPRRSRG